MRIAPRRLWGWEPREETVILERDSDGRVVRSVTRREPEFDVEQVALLLAAHEIEHEPRGSHGHLMSEATDPANQFRWKAHLKTDYAARAIADTAAATHKKYPDGNHNGHVWTVSLD